MREVCGRFSSHPLCNSGTAERPPVQPIIVPAAAGPDMNLPPPIPSSGGGPKPAALLEAEDFCRRYRDAYDAEPNCRFSETPDIFCRVYLKTCRPIYMGGVRWMNMLFNQRYNYY